jgi:hypothetical protein
MTCVDDWYLFPQPGALLVGQLPKQGDEVELV